MPSFIETGGLISWRLHETTLVCTRFLLHFFDGLCYNSLQVITYDVFFVHSPPFT